MLVYFVIVCVLSWYCLLKDVRRTDSRPLGTELLFKSGTSYTNRWPPFSLKPADEKNVTYQRLTGETHLQRAKTNLEFTKQEILLILRSYLSHPTRWVDIIQAIKDNSDQLNRDVRELYRCSSEEQLKDRVSTKMKKLMALDDIEDDDIRVAVQSIKELEIRRVRPQQEQQQIRDARDNIAANLSPSSSEKRVPEQVDLPAPATRSRRRTSKRPLADIIWENQVLYNKFMKKKMPKLLRELRVSSDSSESDS